MNGPTAARAREHWIFARQVHGPKDAVHDTASSVHAEVPSDLPRLLPAVDRDPVPSRRLPSSWARSSGDSYRQASSLLPWLLSRLEQVSASRGGI